MRLKDNNLPKKHERKMAKLHEEHESSPLQRGDILPWKGSSLYPSFLDSSPANPHPRTPIVSLLSSSAPCRSRNGERRLELIEPIRVGNFEEGSSQVWRCRVLRQEKDTSEGDVVLKLFYQNWYQYVGFGYSWKDGESMAEDEALAYERFKSLQGSEVPICYGFYNFNVPGGFVIKGVVLEDLTLISKTLKDESKRMHPKRLSKVAYSEWLDHILTRLCISIHHIHDCRITLDRTIRGTDILVPLKSSSKKSSDDPYAEPMIFIGFGGSSPFFEDELEPESEAYYRGVRNGDCTDTLDVLTRNDIFPNGAVRRWKYYARKEGHFLLEKGIVFDGGRLSELYVESDSEEESIEHTLGRDESETESASEEDSDSEGDSGSGAESD